MSDMTTSIPSHFAVYSDFYFSLSDKSSISTLLISAELSAKHILCSLCEVYSDSSQDPLFWGCRPQSRKLTSLQYHLQPSHTSSSFLFQSRDLQLEAEMKDASGDALQDMLRLHSSPQEAFEKENEGSTPACKSEGLFQTSC